MATALVAGLTLLAACTTAQQPYADYAASSIPGTTLTGPVIPNAGPAGSGATQSAGRAIAILLPLSGVNAPLAQAMLQAAQLALSGSDMPPLLPEDTAGTPEGAANAARVAAQSGAGLILGPLTAGETGAAALVAQSSGIPMLAFTSDPAQARPGVWILGLTPLQQIRRLLVESATQGHTRIAGLLAESAFGDAMAAALSADASALAFPSPRIQRYGQGFSEINGATRNIADYAARRGSLDAQIKAAKAEDTSEGRRHVAELRRQSVAPPPFDTLLLAETGEKLQEIAQILPYYDIAPPQVRLIGPALWAALAGHVPALNGAWYAAPDPAARQGFVDAFTQRNAAPPPPLADLAFDAAAIGRVAAQQGGFTANSLMRPQGFAGVDGVLALLPDGSVRRGLAIFQIGPGGAQIIAPAPTALSAPGA